MPIKVAVRLLLVLAAVLVLVGAWAVLRLCCAPPGAARPATTRVAPPIRAVPPDSVIDGPVVDEHRIGEYRVRVVEDTATRERVVDITRGTRRVFARRSADYRIERAGQDLTGDGQPDVVLVEFTGGLHCCSRATVLGLGRTFADYGTVDGADGDIVLDDLDRDGVPEIRIGDFRFAYWRDVPFADTPVPEVLLRFRAGRYVVACDLMREPPPDDETLRAQARDLARGWVSGDPPVDFWGYAVDLVYAGEAEAAWRFFDLGWPRAIPGRDAFVKDLRSRLTGGPCWTPPPAATPAS